MSTLSNNYTISIAIHGGISEAVHTIACIVGRCIVIEDKNIYAQTGWICSNKENSCWTTSRNQALLVSIEEAPATVEGYYKILESLGDKVPQTLSEEASKIIRNDLQAFVGNIRQGPGILDTQSHKNTA